MDILQVSPLARHYVIMVLPGPLPGLVEVLDIQRRKLVAASLPAFQTERYLLKLAPSDIDVVIDNDNVVALIA